MSVHYATQSGTALAGQDFTAQAGDLVFPPGVTSQTVSVPIPGDALTEADESFSLVLSAPSGATLESNQIQGVIHDFNALPLVQIQGTTIQEGNAGTSPANFVVTLSAPKSQPITVAYTTVDGTATSTKDYLAQSGTLTFNPGETQKTITVPVIGDTLDEPHNQFYVRLSAPVGAVIDVAQARCYIYNDDDAVFISLPTTATITEPSSGGVANLVITATLSAASGKTITVGWQTLADGTAVDGKNFIGQYGGLTFSPGVTTQTLTIPIVGDLIKTPNLTFSIQLQSSLINATYGNTATQVTIVNSDLQPTISLANASVTEGNSGTKQLTFTATLSAPVNQAISVSYATSAGSATATSDYTQSSGVLTFAANATTATFTVPIRGDTSAESNETFNVTLSNPVGATIAVGQAVGTILDDDGAPVPAAPTGFAASAAFAAAVLSWQTVPGATSYNVYRSTAMNGEGTTPLATGITGTTFVDRGLTNGTPYYYRVTAVKLQAGVPFEGSASSEAAVAPTNYSFPYFFTHQSYSFANYLTNQSNLLRLNGLNVENAGLFGTNLQLTDGGTNQTDSVFTLNPVDIGRFTTNFTFEQIPTINYSGALGGGLTFTIQGNSAAALGTAGAGLGYAGIANSVAIKFDLSDDAGEGPNSTGLYTNGAPPTAGNSINLSGTGIDLHSGHLFNVAMSYDGATLVVTITDTVTQAQATQSYTVNIPGLVGGSQAYVGFTGGTAAQSAIQSITNWTFTPAPSAPTGLQASANGIQVNLTWTNHDPNATGVVIERKTGAAGAYAVIGTTSAPSANSFLDTTAAGNTTYFYRVRATNSGSTSLASNEVSATTATAPADLQVTVTDGQATATPGGMLTYTIVVTNAGPNTVTGANIVSTLSAGFDTTWGATTFTATATGGASGFWADAIGPLNNTVTMPPGSTITYLLQARLSAGATGSVSNLLNVTAPVGVTDPNLANNTATDTDTVSGTPQADLQITLSDGQTSVTPGAAVTYTIVVTNAGPATVAGVQIVDNLPAVFGSPSFTATATGGASGFWASAIGNLNNTVTMPPGSTITYLLSGILTAGATGSVANTASVTAPAGVSEINPANNTATDTDTVSGTPQADLQVTVTDGQTSATPGGAVTYTIVVTNAGPNTVTGANIVSTLSAGFDTSWGATTFTATATGGAAGFWADAIGPLNNTVTMPPGSTITYLLHGTLSATATGSVSNTVSVTAPVGLTEINPANNTATDTDTVGNTPQADLQVTVTDGQSTATPGGMLTYTIVVTNAGPNTVSGANIVSTLSAGFDTTWGATTFTATATGGASGFWADAIGALNNTVTMPPGSTITYLLQARLSAGATGSVSNLLNVTAPVGVTDPNLANNTATDTDTVSGTPQADLQVTMTDGQTSATPGSAVTYTIVVTNAGPNTVTGANIVSTLSAGFDTSWGATTFTATATGGAAGFWADAIGPLNNTVTMPPGSTITYLLHGTLSATATGSVSNTVSVTAPVGLTEINPANNTATDTDTVGTGLALTQAATSPAVQTAPTLDFSGGFAGAASKFNFNGSSAKIVGSTLQLTSGKKNQTASIFTHTAVDVTRFDTDFAFQTVAGSNPSGEGLTFTIQGVGPKVLGGAAAGLGYAKLKNSVALKFDLYSNAGEGASSTGFYTKGAVPTNVGSTTVQDHGIDFHSGHVFVVHLDYDGTNLAVSIMDTTTLALAEQRYVANIPLIVGASKAYLGFTAATSTHTASQTILSWTYRALNSVSMASAAPMAPANVKNSSVVSAPTTVSTPVAPAVPAPIKKAAVVVRGRRLIEVPPAQE